MRRSGIPLIAQHIAHAEITQPRLRQWSLIAYGITLDFASIGLIVGALLSGYRLGAVIPTSIMAIATFAGEKQSIRVGPNLEASAGFLPGLFTAVALGPISAMLVVVVGLLANLGRPWTRWFVWTGSCCLIYGIAGIISNLFQNTRSLDILFLMICTAAIVIVGGQALFGSITLLIRRSLSGIGNHLITIVRVSTLSMIIYVPVVTGLLYVYVSLSSWAVVLFIGPAVAAQRYFVLYRSQRETAIELTKAIKQLERVNLSFATALVTALDARDHYTAGHSATVAVYAKDIANAMGLEEEDQEKAHICGLLHDIGKIGVPTGVLEKKGPLNEGERKAIEGHTDVGASILSRIAGYEEIAVAVRHHHERFDGSGYPR
jgi:putative nucleotidyltransferase with HDIG domain